MTNQYLVQFVVNSAEGKEGPALNLRIFSFWGIILVLGFAHNNFR